jgi:dTDP-4-amino-4,6-dideoxygalactose transaminase
MFSVHIPPETDAIVAATLHSGYVGQGPQVERFERELTAFLGVDHVLTVNSCTSALQLALRIAGVGPGDEVITTPMTCAATNLPILAQGASPVWADVDPVSGLIDPDSVRGLVTTATRAILSVDWGGAPCSLDAVQALAAEVGVPTINDAAQALGAVYRGRPLAAWSDFTCFSFQAIKQLTTGDGGALVSRRLRAHQRGRRLRWYGIAREGGGNHWDKDIDDWGYKFHMNDVAAAIGLAQMPHIEAVLRRHAETASYYDDNLSLFFVRAFDRKRHESEGTRSACWLYTVLLPSPELRSRFIEHMAGCRIEVSPVHRRNDHLSVFRNARRGALRGLAWFSDRQVSLPVHRGVGDQDRERVVGAANAFAANQARAGAL